VGAEFQEGGPTSRSSRRGRWCGTPSPSPPWTRRRRAGHPEHVAVRIAQPCMHVNNLVRKVKTTKSQAIYLCNWDGDRSNRIESAGTSSEWTLSASKPESTERTGRVGQAYPGRRPNQNGKFWGLSCRPCRLQG
jgi:hypothetical protein